METKELIFKDGSKFIIQCDANTNISPLVGCNDDYVTEVVGRI